MTISVIVPVYNQERYVRKCLRSILQQDFQDLEVIVINDGSADKSLSIVKKIAEKDNRVKIVDKKNEGVSFARRDGLKVARGTYVCFVDSDDFLPPHALKTLYDIMIREDVDVVAGQCIRQMGLYKRRGRSLERISGRKLAVPELWDDFYISFFGVNILPVQMWGKIYKKSVIDKAMSEVSLFSDTIRTMGEDEYFNLMLHPYINSMYVSNKHIYVYRYGGGTSKYNPHLCELYEFSDIRLDLLDQYKYSQAYDTLFIEYKNYIFSDICQRMEYQHDGKAQICSFLKEELGKRKVFKRMQSLYEGKSTSEEMDALLSQDTEKIWSLANKRLEKGQKRRWLKKCICRFFK